MKTSLKAGFAQIFSCCPKNLSCPKFGEAAAPLAPPGPYAYDFDQQKPGINSEAVTKSNPRGFLKVTLLEKGVKFSFVLIAIIRYFKLSSKQIMSILRKFLSSSSHLIVKLD